MNPTENMPVYWGSLDPSLVLERPGMGRLSIDPQGDHPDGERIDSGDDKHDVIWTNGTPRLEPKEDARG